MRTNTKAEATSRQKIIPAKRDDRLMTNVGFRMGWFSRLLNYKRAPQHFMGSSILAALSKRARFALECPHAGALYISTSNVVKYRVLVHGIYLT